MNAADFWFFVGLMVGILMLVKMITTCVTTSIRAYHENRPHWGKDQHGVPPMFRKMTDSAMADRDAEIANMRERIEVLEAIVTDQHNQSKVRELADEIDSLNRD